MAWFKVEADRLSRRLDDPNDRNTFPEYEHFNKGDVFELDKESVEAKRRLKNGSISVASNEEAAQAKKARDEKEKAEIGEAQAQLETQREYLAGLEADRVGAPGERQFQPDLAEERARLEAERAEQAKKAEAEAEANAKKTAQAGAKKTAPAQQQGQPAPADPAAPAQQSK